MEMNCSWLGCCIPTFGQSLGWLWASLGLEHLWEGRTLRGKGWHQGISFCHCDGNPGTGLSWPKCDKSENDKADRTDAHSGPCWWKDKNKIYRSKINSATVSNHGLLPLDSSQPSHRQQYMFLGRKESELSYLWTHKQTPQLPDAKEGESSIILLDPHKVFSENQRS